MVNQEITISARGESYRLAYFDRPGTTDTFLYVHGLGCSSADFSGMIAEPALAGARLIAFDLPGCGGSPYDPRRPLDIDGMVELLASFIEALSLRDCKLVGASMGGIVGLLYAERAPERLKALISVEGNLTADDCMLTRYVVTSPFEKFETEVLPKIKKAIAARRGRGFAAHLALLEAADRRAYYDQSFQLVEYSDHGNLIERFLALGSAKYFIHGAENRHLRYLPQLRESDCRVFEIPGANHFPFYDDPGAFAAALSECR